MYNIIFDTIKENCERLMKGIYKFIPLLVSMMAMGCTPISGDPVESVSLNNTSLTIRVGETFQLVATVEPDTAYGKVTWSSSNSEYATVSSSGMVEALQAGHAIITATSVSGKKTATCQVTVRNKLRLSSISLSENRKTEYVEGEVFEKPEVTARYSNNSTKVVTNETTFTGYNLATTGTYTVTASYTEDNITKTADYEISVEVPRVLQSIEIIEPKTEYFTGDTFSKPVVTAYYDDSSSENVSSSAVFTGYDMQTSGNQTVEVSYTYKDVTLTDSYNISVTQLQVVNLQISSPKTEYYTGDTLTKPVVTATYNSGKTTTVTSSAEFSGYDLNNSGVQTVKVSFGGMEITYQITVIYKPASIIGDFELYKESSLDVGSYIVLASAKSGSVKAMSTNQKTNSRGTVSRTVSNNILTTNSSTATFLVEEGTTTGTYALYDEILGGYLCAAGSSSSGGWGGYNSDILKTTTEGKSSATDFKFVNNDGQATLTSQGTASSNTIGYSSNSDAFSCFKRNSWSSSYSLPYIFYKSSQVIYAESISIYGGDEVAVDGSISLYVSYNPVTTNQKKVTWTSSDTSVATVTGGVVQGLKAGSTTITASVPGENDTVVTATKVINVVTVSVSGVSLNKTTAEISLGRTLQLNASISPSNATNKKVSWSSSNTSVATVSSSGLVTASSSNTGSAVITVTTEDGSKTATCDISVVEQAKDAWTILLYMCGADLESDNQLATSDLREILSVSGQPDDVNFVIETGGAKSWSSTYNISSTYLERYHVANKKLVKDASLSYDSMGKSATLQSFLEYGLTNYPAENTGLILWNHGGGLQGVCFDQKEDDDSLTDNEVVSAVKNALSNSGMTGQKLEWIGYDACLMQVQDIAEFNSPYFNYMVGSEESEAGYGWDYDNWVDDLYAKKDTEVILKAICDSFIKDNGGATSTSGDQTLSFLDLSLANEYLTAWEAMAAQLKNKITSSNKSSFNTLVKSAKHYADTSYSYYGLFDAKDFLNKLKSNSTFDPGGSYISNVLDAHSRFVKYSTAQIGAGESYGLCMYWAVSSQTTSYNTYSSTTSNFANWVYLSKTYHG